MIKRISTLALLFLSSSASGLDYQFIAEGCDNASLYRVYINNKLSGESQKNAVVVSDKLLQCNAVAAMTCVVSGVESLSSKPVSMPCLKNFKANIFIEIKQQ